MKANIYKAYFDKVDEKGEWTSVGNDYEFEGTLKAIKKEYFRDPIHIDCYGVDCKVYEGDNMILHARKKCFAKKSTLLLGQW